MVTGEKIYLASALVVHKDICKAYFRTSGLWLLRVGATIVVHIEAGESSQKLFVIALQPNITSGMPGNSTFLNIL